MSKRSRQAQDVLRQVRKDEIGRDRSHQVQARLAEFALDVVLGGEAEAAGGLQADVGRLPGRLRGEVLRHVRLPTAVKLLPKKRSGLVAHQLRSLDLHVAPGDGALDALVLPDRSV